METLDNLPTKARISEDWGVGGGSSGSGLCGGLEPKHLQPRSRTPRSQGMVREGHLPCGPKLLHLYLENNQERN